MDFVEFTPVELMLQRAEAIAATKEGETSLKDLLIVQALTKELNSDFEVLNDLLVRPDTQPWPVEGVRRMLRYRLRDYLDLTAAIMRLGVFAATVRSQHDDGFSSSSGTVSRATVSRTAEVTEKLASAYRQMLRGMETDNTGKGVRGLDAEFAEALKALDGLAGQHSRTRIAKASSTT